MTEAGRKYLSDIMMAINLINRFIEDTPDFNPYLSDQKTQSAVERQLAIIGEALNKFRKSEPEVTIKYDKQVLLEIVWCMLMTVLIMLLSGQF